MRVILQRVSQASVTINEQVFSEIKTGILVLCGIESADTEEDAAWLCSKICNLRIFSDTDGKMNLSVKDTGGDILLVSQFTLHASTKKGNRPSYKRASRPEHAVPLYELFKTELGRELGKPVKTGQFGADMEVALVNDGPVTISIDSKSRE